jgi:hypothetical protein
MGRDFDQEAGTEDGHGRAFGRDVRPWCAMTLPTSSALAHHGSGCDALNTTVSVSWPSSELCALTPTVARGYPRMSRIESRPVVVDFCFAGWLTCKLLFNYLGTISHRSVIFSFMSYSR